jgi:hypothetical protein
VGTPGDHKPSVNEPTAARRRPAAVYSIYKCCLIPICCKAPDSKTAVGNPSTRQTVPAKTTCGTSRVARPGHPADTRHPRIGHDPRVPSPALHPPPGGSPSMMKRSSPLSSLPICPAPPGSTQTPVPLPCRTDADDSLCTRGTLPDMRPLKHVSDLHAPGRDPGSRSPSQVIDGLLSNGHVARRSPSGPRHRRSRGFTPSLVSAVRRFRHAEYTSSCLPTDARRSRSGTVSGRDHWQALAGLSWLSCSRPSDLPRVPDSGQGAGPTCRQVEDSPRQPS